MEELEALLTKPTLKGFGKKSAEQVAAAIMLRIFDDDKFSDAIRAYLRPILETIYASGAVNQAAIHDMLVRRGRRLTDALAGGEKLPLAPPPIPDQAVLNQLGELGLELPKGLSVELPPWLANHMRKSIDEQLSHPYWDDIAKTTRNDFSSVLKDGLTEGKSIPQIRKDIQEVAPEYDKFRAERVARSESAAAQNAGALDVLRQANDETAGGMNEKQLLAVLDERTRATHVAADGQVRKLDEPFNIGGYPAMVPGDPSLPPQERINCVLPGTIIQGSFDVAMRAWYEGEIVEIVTAGGRRLACTPNHAICTSRQLVPSGSINIGDQLLTTKCQVDNLLAVKVPREEEYDKPTAIENVFESFARTGLSERRRRHANDFDGDGEFCQGDIEFRFIPAAIASDLYMLIHEIMAINAAKKVRDLIFVASMSASRILRSMRSFAVCTKPFPAKNHLLLVIANLYASLSQARIDDCPRYAEVFGDLCSGLTSQILPHQFINIDLRSTIFPSQPMRFGRASQCDASLDEVRRNGVLVYPRFVRDVHNRLSGQVEFDRVVSVERREYVGHVFDLRSWLSRKSGYRTGTMIADGIITGQCRCAVISAATLDSLS